MWFTGLAENVTIDQAQTGVMEEGDGSILRHSSIKNVSSVGISLLGPNVHVESTTINGVSDATAGAGVKIPYDHIAGNADDSVTDCTIQNARVGIQDKSDGHAVILRNTYSGIGGPSVEVLPPYGP